MPYKNHKEQLAYSKGFYAGCRYMTIKHLGGECNNCGETDIYKLEIHHINPLRRLARSEQDLKDLSQLKIKCKNPKCSNYHKRRNYKRSS